ncbi:MAG: hypothetical protein NVSMB31_19520 [Vulcanimicrobiaceae bacterium]
MMKILCALALVFATLGAASDQNTAVMVAIHQFIDGFDRGDAKSALAACASPVSIVDEFPPHAWQGPTACADWARDFDANSKKAGITDTFVTLGKPLHVDVSGNRAYAVVPAAYTYKLRGKGVAERNSVFTVALRKSGSVWLITGWAWSKR